MYSPPEDEEQFLENYFDSIENDATPALRKLGTDGDISTLKSKDREAFAKFIAAQQVRTLKHHQLSQQSARASLFHAKEDPKKDAENNL